MNEASSYYANQAACGPIYTAQQTKSAGIGIGVSGGLSAPFSDRITIPQALVEQEKRISELYEVALQLAGKLYALTAQQPQTNSPSDLAPVSDPGCNMVSTVLGNTENVNRVILKLRDLYSSLLV